MEINMKPVHSYAQQEYSFKIDGIVWKYVSAENEEIRAFQL